MVGFFVANTGVVADALAHPDTLPYQNKNTPIRGYFYFWWEWLDCNSHIRFRSMGPFRLRLEPVVASRLFRWFSSQPAQTIKKTDPTVGCFYGGSGWIRTSSGLSQQIYSLPRLSNSGARPIRPKNKNLFFGAGSGNRTRISSLEGLHTSLCTMPATNSKPTDYIIYEIKIKHLI